MAGHLDLFFQVLHGRFMCWCRWTMLLLCPDVAPKLILSRPSVPILLTGTLYCLWYGNSSHRDCCACQSFCFLLACLWIMQFCSNVSAKRFSWNCTFCKMSVCWHCNSWHTSAWMVSRMLEIVCDCLSTACDAARVAFSHSPTHSGQCFRSARLVFNCPRI